MSSLGARPHASGQGEPDQFGEAARCHLVHYARTVDLYSTGTEAIVGPRGRASWLIRFIDLLRSASQLGYRVLLLRVA